MENEKPIYTCKECGGEFQPYYKRSGTPEYCSQRCYHRSRKGLKGPTRYATCHPNLLHYAKGLCQTCYNRQDRMVNYPDFLSRSRKYLLRKSYGLTPEAYEALNAAQDGHCAICGQTVEGNLHVDHDHTTGVVRGLLCRLCNTALGKFQDSTDLLQKAIAYLHDPPAISKP